MSQKKKYVFFVILGILIGIFLKLFIFDITFVSGTSMETAIKDGEKIFISKLAYGIVTPFGESLLLSWKEPKKNDIVLYIYNGKPVIKRVIAREYEKLEYSADNGYSMKVGEKIIPLTEAQYQRIKYDSFVPEGTVLCVGDNYEESVDSRNYGFVKTNSILGKVLWK